MNYGPMKMSIKAVDGEGRLVCPLCGCTRVTILDLEGEEHEGVEPGKGETLHAAGIIFQGTCEHKWALLALAVNGEVRFSARTGWEERE